MATELLISCFEKLQQIVTKEQCLRLSENFRNDIQKECAILEKDLEELSSKSDNVLPNKPETEPKFPCRDRILHKLSQFWELYHAIGVQLLEKESICPSLVNYCWSFSEELIFLSILFESLKSVDHFVTFQAYKVFQEILKSFPGVILQSSFNQWVPNCLRRTTKNSQWTIMYVSKIFLDLFNFYSYSSDRILNWRQALSGSINKSRCVCDKTNLLEKVAAIDFSRIFHSICEYWLEWSQGCLNNICVMDNRTTQETQPKLEIPLTLALSLGSNLVKLYQTDQMTLFLNDTQNYNPQILAIAGKDLLKLLDSTFIHELATKLLDSGNKHTNPVQLSRSVVEFLSDVIGLGFHHSSITNPHIDEKIQAKVGDVCICLLKNVSQLFESVPRLSPDFHFGGENHTKFSGAEMKYEVLDLVFVRKVVLLVGKSLLVVFKDEAKSQFGQLIEIPLQTMVTFITEKLSTSTNDFQPAQSSMAKPLIKLFTDQDDELMTVLLCLFKLFQKLHLDSSFNNIPTEGVNHLSSFLNPHQFFLEFLRSIDHDNSLLLDFLISSETCFLEYFLSYLHHIANDWGGFLKTIKEFDLREQYSEKVNSSVKTFCNQVMAGKSVIEQRATSSSEYGICLSQGAVFGENGDGKGKEESLVVLNNSLFSIKDSYEDLSSSGSDGEDNDGVCGDGYDNRCGGGSGDHGEGHGSCGSDSGNGGGGNSNCQSRDSGVYGIFSPNNDLTSSCNAKTLDKSLSCFIRLRYSIERMVSKQLFPYPVEALLKVMKYIENLYEKGERANET